MLLLGIYFSAGNNYKVNYFFYYYYCQDEFRRISVSHRLLTIITVYTRI